MKRSILAFLAGLLLWAVVATLLNFGLRAGIARLIVGALSSLAAGAVTAMIAPSKKNLPWVLGAVILAAFIPAHIRIWAKFPVWYHLTFLTTLVPLVVLGGALPRSSFSNRAAKSGVTIPAKTVSGYHN